MTDKAAFAVYHDACNAAYNAHRATLAAVRKTARATLTAALDAAYGAYIDSEMAEKRSVSSSDDGSIA